MAAFPSKEKEYVAAYRKRWLPKHLDRLKLFSNLKEERGCFDCGGMFPAEALDWDHLPGERKAFNIGAAITKGMAIETIFAEIQKCQCVCATCHRIRTQARRRNYA